MDSQITLLDTFSKLFPKKVLEKADKMDGWIYICPVCKTYVCGQRECRCGQMLDYSQPRTIYRGKYYY